MPASDQTRIYAPPKANLNSSKTVKRNLRAMSVWNLILLNIVTLGFYRFFWMYKRSRELNIVLGRKQIPMWFAVVLVANFVVYYSVVLLQALGIENANWDALSPISNGIDLVIYLFWILAVRHALRSAFLSEIEPGLRNVSLLWSLVFGSLYYQYRINQNYQYRINQNLAERRSTIKINDLRGLGGVPEPQSP